MNKPVDLPQRDFNDEDSNTSSNPSFESVLNARLSRRNLLRGSVGTAATALLGGLSLAACGGDDDTPAATAPAEALLGFNAVAKSLEDKFTVPTGYTASVLLAVGDPLAAGVAAYKNDGTDTGYDRRSGDNHDGMEYFGLSAAGTPDPTNNDRALLGINHEYVNLPFLHANGTTANPRPAAEADIEVDCHGVSIVEIAKTAGKFGVVQSSAFNRRITAATEIELSGPVRGHALAVTKFSTTGTRTRGTVNNCGTGKTPWGTLLTGEENWVGYYFRAAGDPALRGAKGNTALVRYGSNATATAAAASRYGWETAGAADKYARWNTSVTGVSIDGSDDYRHEVNTQGYVTEIDPYNASSVVKKRTALGRMAHESAAFSKPVVGKPLAVYMGDDARNEYIYKFVSTQTWVAADASAADRVATGDKYLDAGKLYVAKFNADGTGQWIELSLTNPTVAGYANYAFADAGDVAMHPRIAGDAVGATKMDRPEWCGVHPNTGEVYFTLTNNSNRRLGTVTGSQLNPDAANPRVYTDIRGAATAQSGNPNGHIIRVKEAAGEPGATAFSWDIFLFGAETGAPSGIINLSGLSADQDFSSPDGLVFTPSTGLCWVQTDDGAYTDVSNCMMLAAVPGTVGDGGALTLDYGANGTVTTRMGKKPTAATLKRFLVGPAFQEITGLCESPDGKVLFVNVQHPGEEDSNFASVADPSKFRSHWPGNAGYGAGGATARPRAATVMVVKDNGGRVGS
ncbi:Phosphatase [Rubrivivax sp. A210]|uniref:PhoX family protein n=1 Tax=Rubrivivax sp. A210 TaxID=2772301 RepID=UPI00191B7545|nr:PhoX family phosphatase [Rubrivivax sp. A210]CAD5371389.1 Phosphatase [Rubrivivax sp. A210]